MFTFLIFHSILNICFLFCMSSESFYLQTIHVQSQPLIESNKMLLPPLHIKFGVMKNFVKAMDKESSEFAFLLEKFPQISMEKLKAGIFDSPQIRELMKDPIFDKALSGAKLSPWQSLKSLVTNFLENHQSAEYKEEIEKLLKSFRQLVHTLIIFQRTA